MDKPIYNINESVYYYNKWSNKIEKGNIENIRTANLNWDYNIRYKIYNNLAYKHWIQQNHIKKNKEDLYKFLK